MMNSPPGQGLIIDRISIDINRISFNSFPKLEFEDEGGIQLNCVKIPYMSERKVTNKNSDQQPQLRQLKLV